MESASRVIKHFNPERFGWAIETDGGQCRCLLAVMTILLCYERLITNSTNFRPLPSLKLCFSTANDQKRKNILEHIAIVRRTIEGSTGEKSGSNLRSVHALYTLFLRFTQCSLRYYPFLSADFANGFLH